MEKRRLPRGNAKEEFGVLGIGLGSIQGANAEEIEECIRTALDAGVNFFDLCAGGSIAFAPFGRAVKGRREEVFFQMHIGAVYNEKGEYGWSRDLEKIRSTVEWELETIGTNYADFGFLHCVDTIEDYEKLLESGVLDYLKELHAAGTVRHMGFSTHTPALANRVLDDGWAEMMLLSINPAYDYECGDEWGVGSAAERQALQRRCQAEGVGISVMKPFHGGQLLDAAHSPFKEALTISQCIQYVLDRPGVLCAVPGIRGMDDLKDILGFLSAGQAEKDYSVIGSFSAEKIRGACVYCGHCQPCPAGIEIGLVNKYYDLARAGDRLAADHYRKLEVKADECVHCGHCDGRCPFGAEQSRRMEEIAGYFAGRLI